MQPSTAVIALGLVAACALRPDGAPAQTPTVPKARKIEFFSAARPLGPLQAKRAKQLGEPTTKPGDQISGYLIRPDGDGPFGSIVLLPDCAGLTVDMKEDLPEKIVSWGYVALVVDSFTSRGAEPTCVGKERSDVDRVADGYGALFHLARQSFVSPDRIGVVGVGSGGKIAFGLAEAQPDEPVITLRA